jgi:hypothetical protein
MSRPEDEYPNEKRRYPDAEPTPESAGSADFQTNAGLRDLSQGRWAAAEQRFTGSLARGAARSKVEALAVIGVAQSRLFGRRNARGAFALLQSLLGQESSLGSEERARLHVVAAFLFSGDEVGLYEPARARRHAELGLELSSRGADGDLAALAACAELLIVALDGEPRAFLELSASRAELVSRASGPVTRCLVLEVEALVAHCRGQTARAAELLGRALENARALSFAACEARLVRRIARRALDACAPDDMNTTSRAALSTGNDAAGVEGISPELSVELRRLAPSRVTVLLVGGSELLRGRIARALHEHSPRAGGPFVAFDCEALDSNAAELRLFGGPPYAVRARGAVHAAETGTLYVAAIDQLPLLIQPRFLRFLDQDTSVRVVASAHVDLAVCVARGHFRGDLGERLTLVQLVLPPQIGSV